MTTTAIKTRIATQIKTESLITYKIQHVNIEKNFQLIVEALLLNEDDINGLKVLNNKSISKLTEFQKILQNTLDKQRQTQVKVQIAEEKIKTLNDKFHQLQKNLLTLQSQFTKEKQNNKAQLQKMILNPQNQPSKKLKNTQVSNKLQNITLLVAAHQQLIKNIQQKLNNNQISQKQKRDALNKQLDITRKQISAITEGMDLDLVRKQIEEIKSKLNKNNFEEELLKLQTQINKQKRENNQNHNHMNEEIQKLKNLLEEEKKKNIKNSQQLWKLNEQMHKMESEKLQSEMNSPKTLHELQKDVSDIKIKLSILFKSDNNGRTKGSYIHKQNQNTQQNTYSPNRYNNQENGQADFRDQMLNRMNQTKTEILRVIKKADLFSNPNNDYDPNKILQIVAQMKKIDYILGTKSDEQSVKKRFTYFQNKINYIWNYINLGNQEDALAVKRQWFCLSCDKTIQNYKGKVGPYLSNMQSKGKAIETDTVGGGMNTRSKSKVQFPTLNKLKKQKQK